MVQRLLIDTGAIYAFVTRNDPHHESAKSFMAGWLARRGTFVLTDAVFAETMTLLKVRLGSDIAIRVGQELRRNPAYLWLALGPEGERDTWALFQRYRDKDWSFTDCALLATSRRAAIPQIFAFDHHFSQMPDLELLPQT